MTPADETLPSDAAQALGEDIEPEHAEVSLRAVEILSRGQALADEAVAEAQAYARDLEEAARTQYREILQRAHDAAREMAPGGDGQAPGTGPSPDTAAPGVATQELEYARTYARVAHSQLSAVMEALSSELDRLADMAEPPRPGTPADAADDPLAGQDPDGAPSQPWSRHLDEPGQAHPTR